MGVHRLRSLHALLLLAPLAACGTVQAPAAAAAPAQAAAVPAEPPRRAVIIEKVDADRDGVPDLDDRCPAAPGPARHQGCPDRDGDGLPDLEDACPAEPGPQEAQGCPAAKDADGDGIPDDIDRCPLDPEDFDGFQEEDGCPDPDNDGDGLVDKVDACPNTPGPFEARGCPALDGDGDGVPDGDDRCADVPGVAPDGCPRRYALVEVRRDLIATRQQVHFDTAKWRVLPDSFPLLDQVAQVLRDQPGLRLSIQGHTDAAGDEALNLALSQARAEEVRAYLVRKGIAPGRLAAAGHGSARPIASNQTEAGRAQNRRIEFRIVPTE